MKVTDFYKYVMWGLLVLNLLLIAFLVWNKPPKHKGEGPGPLFKNKIIEQLKLDDEQQKEFLISVSNHIDKMESLVEQKEESLKIYFGTMSGESTQEQAQVAIENVEGLERNMVEATYIHLSEIKSLMKPEQESEFEQFKDEILQNIMPSRKNKSPKPRK